MREMEQKIKQEQMVPGGRLKLYIVHHNFYIAVKLSLEQIHEL